MFVFFLVPTQTILSRLTAGTTQGKLRVALERWSILPSRRTPPQCHRSKKSRIQLIGQKSLVATKAILRRQRPTADWPLLRILGITPVAIAAKTATTTGPCPPIGKEIPFGDYLKCNSLAFVFQTSGAIHQHHWWILYESTGWLVLCT